MDTQLSMAWSSIFTSLTLPRSDSFSYPSTVEFLNIFQTLFNFLSSQNTGLQRAASEALVGFLHLNFATHADLATLEGKACVDSILSQLSQSLVSLPFAHALPYTLNVLASTLFNFPYSRGASNDETLQLAAPLIISVSKLRISNRFYHKEGADRVFVSAYLRWGAQRILELVPLNLDPSDR
jgi:hypothetical protein